MGEDIDKVIGALKEHSEYGLTLTELMSISGLAHASIIGIFEILEDEDKLLIKSDGLSRIYRLKM